MTLERDTTQAPSVAAAEWRVMLTHLIASRTKLDPLDIAPVVDKLPEYLIGFCSEQEDFAFLGMWVICQIVDESDGYWMLGFPQPGASLQ